MSYTIFKYATYFTMDCPTDGKLSPLVNLRYFVEKYLTEYEFHQRFKRFLPTKRHYIYDKDTKLARFPVNTLPKLMQFLDENGISYNIYDGEVPKGKKINIKFRDDIFQDKPNQTDIISFLVDENLSYMRPLDAPTGIGKEQPLYSKIKIPGGWTTMGQLKVGDTITAWDGTPTKVTGVFPQGKKEIFRIHFADGRYTDCGAEHLWKVFYINVAPHLRWRVVNTIEVIRMMSIPNPRVYVQLIESEQINDVDLPMDPYTLGALLGDGGMTTNTLRIWTDQSIIDEISAAMPEKMKISILKDKRSSGCVSSSLIGNNTQGLSEYMKHIKNFGLADHRSYEKFIPKIYLEASTSQRLAILQGLLDTDGTVERHSGSVSYSSSSEQLAKDVQYLVRSLGGIASIRLKFPRYTYLGQIKTGRTSYNVNIRYKKPSDLFRLPRKKELTRDEGQYCDILKLRIVKVDVTRPTETQCISIDHPDHLYVTDDFIVTHNTYMAIKAITKIKKVALIIVGGLVDQWQLEFLKYTYLMPDDIYVLQGADSVRKLFAKKLRPKIIIGSLSTIRAYVNATEGSPYDSLPTFSEMLKILGVGIKIIDECHTNFHAGTIIDLKSNVENNIYLSATYERTNKYGQKIFASIFPSDLVYGGVAYKKYVDIYLYGYSLGQMKGLKENTSRGYSQSKYELYIEGHPQIYDEFIDKVVEPLIHGHYINVKKNMQKLLILVHTVSMCERITWSLENLFPTLNIKKYTYEDPDDNLFDGVDIIVSTPKSAGVGRDIKNLKTLLLSCSLASSPLTKQILGRLRELKDDNPIMVDTYNRVLDAHRRHKDARKDIYKKLGRTFKEHQL